jgi:hypothetical protein
VLPEAAHSREVVLELRELDLELPLGALCVLGEDVEDELRAIDDASFERVLECALLRRAQFLVDEENLGAARAIALLQLRQLPLADEGPRVWMTAVLHELRNGLDARRAGELSELCELLLAVDSLREDSEDEPALRRRPGGGIGLARGHRGIMPGLSGN